MSTTCTWYALKEETISKRTAASWKLHNGLIKVVALSDLTLHLNVGTNNFSTRESAFILQTTVRFLKERWTWAKSHILSLYTAAWRQTCYLGSSPPVLSQHIINTFFTNESLEIFPPHFHKLTCRLAFRRAAFFDARARLRSVWSISSAKEWINI